jgi:hypothetical protein
VALRVRCRSAATAVENLAPVENLYDAIGGDAIGDVDPIDGGPHGYGPVQARGRIRRTLVTGVTWRWPVQLPTDGSKAA